MEKLPSLPDPRHVKASLSFVVGNCACSKQDMVTIMICTLWVSEDVVLLAGRARRVKRMVSAGAGPGLRDGADVESRTVVPEIKATPGRPDIHGLLRQICTEHESEQEIGIIAAGTVVWLTCQCPLQSHYRLGLACIIFTTFSSWCWSCWNSRKPLPS